MRLGRAVRSIPVAISLILTAMIGGAGGAWAQNENETVGFRPNHAFESGQFGENIDILNGGLNLTVPIGPSYQVSSRLGHGLTLQYSSKVWDTSHTNTDFVNPQGGFVNRCVNEFRRQPPVST